MHKAENIQQGYYTADQLRTQRELAEGQLRNAQAQLVVVNAPDWQMAVEYGEEVRAAHIGTLNNRIDYLTRRIDAIKLAEPRT